VNSRTVTDSIESRTDPAILVALLADPRRSPEWAPAFADAVTGDGSSGWRAAKDGRDFTFRVAARPDAGTVDYLREIAPGTEAGAYIRVIPRPGGGSVVVMTLPVPPGGDPAATAATLRDELTALVSVGEGR
jgi:Polyketide cyclase / dehydrase and lipid transport